MTASASTPKPSGVRVTEVRVSNFRSLTNVAVDLDDLTVLVGANNAGKTSFLEAIYAAVGAGRKTLGQDDIHERSRQTSPPAITRGPEGTVRSKSARQVSRTAPSPR